MCDSHTVNFLFVINYTELAKNSCDYLRKVPEKYLLFSNFGVKYLRIEILFCLL